MPVETTTLHEFAACANCGHAISSHDGKRGWVHVTSDSYICPPMSDRRDGMGDGKYAEPFDLEASAAQYEEGHQDGFDAGRDDGLDDGEARGREEMRDELLAALDEAMVAAMLTDEQREKVTEAMDNVHA